MVDRTRNREAQPSARFSSLLLLLALGSAAVGCYSLPDPCVKGGEVGKAYLVHLDEVYDGSVTDVLFQQGESRAQTSCMGFDGLMAGMDVELTILPAQAGSQTCITHEGAVTIPSVQAIGPHTTLDGINDIGLDVARFQQSVTVGACSGGMEIDFRSRGDPFAPKSASSPPPFFVDRYFQTSDAAACPGLGAASGDWACADTWVATLVPK